LFCTFAAALLRKSAAALAQKQEQSRNRIYILKNSMPQFISIIEPYIIPSMLYKIKPTFAFARAAALLRNCKSSFAKAIAAAAGLRLQLQLLRKSNSPDKINEYNLIYNPFFTLLQLTLAWHRCTRIRNDFFGVVWLFWVPLWISFGSVLFIVLQLYGNTLALVRKIMDHGIIVVAKLCNLISLPYSEMDREPQHVGKAGVGATF
jgi:hypothetical protein